MILDLNMHDNIIFSFIFLFGDLTITLNGFFSVILLELLINGKVICMG